MNRLATEHTSAQPITPDMIIHFWFEEIEPKQWWIKDAEFDELIKQRYASLLAQAIQGELYHWRATPQGRLAEIIVLDQFSRNIYRDSAKAFAADAIALVLAQEAVAINSDSELKAKQVPFLFMPYMHSESPLVHEVAVRLFSRDAAKGNLDFELRHKAIIDQFGRYPHRNSILDRESTVEEIAFLQQPGSSF
ncbi:DUF924 family protein [Shewanella pealeana]|uniref:DUF924 domain-containing protein n=1 Tax=Shewanella pealeana (strain ATCC 700345 / ANG-SQ1) TaxID=398579 RepID=A8H7Y1_SHEPA|nr:DUF924 family protein [Shewanella pealeana]ABV88668.1 protein of unknown function DUF924 [Shewanella pealeana ATCC 700345]